MTASSQYRKVADIQKQRKVERRNALEGRKKPENNQQEHQETEVREIPTETSSSNSTVKSGEVKVKTSKPKKKAKKASKKG